MFAIIVCYRESTLVGHHCRLALRQQAEASGLAGVRFSDMLSLRPKQMERFIILVIYQQSDGFWLSPIAREDKRLELL